uniref:Uncharacterized protein n=1 Tax=viral metagenome TaxID=1070528 RepID=A0A6C0CH26_9ZZZZ
MIEVYGRPLWEVVLWILLLLIVVWALKQEYRAAKCFDGREDCGTDWAWEPKRGDDLATLFARIEAGNRAENHIISRRLTMILAAAVTLIVMWYFRRQFVPEILEFVVVMVLLMGMIWFGFRYHESHYLAEITRRTDKSIQELKYQTGVADRPHHL